MLRGQPGKELGDLSIGEGWPFIVDEMPGLLGGRKPVIREVVPEPVGPLYLEHGVAHTPQEACRRLDFRKFGRAGADQLYTGLVRAYVPVEPALQVARSHEVVHPGVEILIEEARLVRPVV